MSILEVKYIRKKTVVFGIAVIITGLISPWIFNAIDRLTIGNLTVEPNYILLIRKRLAPGRKVEGRFTVVGGDGDIKFWIKDPHGDIIYDPGVVLNEDDFEFNPKNRGIYFLYFDNSFSDVVKEVSLMFRGMPAIAGIGARMWILILGSFLVLIGFLKS